MKFNIKTTTACALMMASAAVSAKTDGSALTLKGTVLDRNGAPIAGAAVRTEKGGDTAFTDESGNYTITVNDGSKNILFSYVGLPGKTVSVNKASLNGFISMGEPDGSLDEIIDLGFDQVTRRELTGAVSVVSGSVLNKSPESHLSKTFAGRLPGLTVMENNGEPGRIVSSSTDNGVSLYIRGLVTSNGTKPLVIVDGELTANADFMYITPEEIAQVTVLKDASALALYGIQGGNGAIVITTKRGRVGAHRVTVYADQALQQVTTTPYEVSPAMYARLRNQAAFNDGYGAFSKFSETDIACYENGLPGYEGYIPYDELFNKTMWMTRAGVSVSGGTDRVRYYSNVNYMHETSPFKTEKNEEWKYNPASNINRFDFRSNIDVKINSWLSGFASVYGSVNRVKNNSADNAGIYMSLWQTPPTMWGPVVPEYDYVSNPDDPEKFLTPGQVITIDGVSNPVYAMLNRAGYRQTVRTAVNSIAGVRTDLSSLTKGLSLEGRVSFNTTSHNRSNTLQSYQLYVRDNDMYSLNFKRYGTSENSPLGYSKDRQMYYNLNMGIFAKYNRSFGNHFVRALAFYMHQNRESEHISGDKMLPYKRNQMGLSATYGFMGLYFLRGDLGYSGSEAFHKEHRYHTTPAVSATWVLSEESFMQGLKPWLSLVKPRFSWGINDNDQISSTRNLYEDYVDYNGNQQQRGNEFIAPEKIFKTNYGIDLGFFDDDLQVSFDYFRQHCDNIVISSSSLVPTFQGVPLNYYPYVNEGHIKNHGFELAALYHKQINRDWAVFVGGSYSYNRNEQVDMKEARREDYAYPYTSKGQSLGQMWGYVIDKTNGNGYFNFPAELANCGIDYSALGKVRVGDFKYADLNGDGKIDEKDRAPIGYSNVPRGYYSFNAGFAWKDLELSFMFQGVTKRSVYLNGLGVFESSNKGVYSDLHQNAWTQEKWLNDQEISYPALSMSNTASHQANDFFIQDGSYLRLKNAEIAYSLPASWARKCAAQKIRFSLTCQNLFTISHLKTKTIDPEIGSFNVFPTYRVFDLGVKVIF